MQIDRSSPILYIAVFAALVACVALGQTERRASKPRPKTAHPAERGAIDAPKRAEAEPETDPSTVVTPQRVILITLDGWHVRLTDEMPVWKEMAAAGSWTLGAQVPRGATTVISHAALYTGADPKVNGIVRELDRKLDGDPHVHGWRFRWKEPPLKVSSSLFTAVEGAGYKAAAVVQKGKLVQLLRPDGDETGIHQKNDEGLILAACAAARDDATRLVILHVGSPDGAGHEHGWLSDEQKAVARKVSGQLQRIRECLATAEAAGGVPTTLIVTSDHGGTPGKGHGANTPDNLTVPWIAVGPGIRPGHEIRASVRLVDTAPTILRILGIPASSIPTLSGVSLDEIFVRP